MILGTINDPNNVPWLSPIQESWSPVIEWNPILAASNREGSFSVKLNEALASGFVPIAGLIESAGNFFKLIPQSPAAVGKHISFPEEILFVEFSFGVDEILDSVFGLYLDDVLLWEYDSAFFVDGLTDTAIVSLSEFSGLSGLLKWEFTPLSSETTAAFISNVEFFVAENIESEVTPVSEPSTLMILVIGLALALTMAKRELRPQC